MSSVTAPKPVLVRRFSKHDDAAELVDIWRSAVNATHGFLSPEHYAEIERSLVPVYFQHVQLYVAEIGSGIVGFAGVHGDSLEMLFVDAQDFRQGIGSILLTFITAETQINKVEVNEQNPGALAFYQRHGFKVMKRSDSDGQGWPYPILHLERVAPNA